MAALGAAGAYFLEHAQERTINIFFGVLIGFLLLVVSFLFAGEICGVTL
jgi:hypothetical protein